MESIDFPEATTDLAKNQPEYTPVRVFMDPGPQGLVISCWKFSFWERLNILFGGKLYLSLMMFRDLKGRINPVTPVYLAAFKSDMFTTNTDSTPVKTTWLSRMHARQIKRRFIHDVRAEGSRAEQ